MTLTTPTLFGRITAIQQDHTALLEALRRLRAATQQLLTVSDASPAETMQLVATLAGELQGHFAAEEAEGYFGAVAADRPSLRPTIDSLCADHQVILHTLLDFPILVAAGVPNRELAARVNGVLDLLQIHERRETELMQEYLLKDDEVPFH